MCQRACGHNKNRKHGEYFSWSAGIFKPDNQNIKYKTDMTHKCRGDYRHTYAKTQIDFFTYKSSTHQSHCRQACFASTAIHVSHYLFLAILEPDVCARVWEKRERGSDQCAWWGSACQVWAVRPINDFLSIYICIKIGNKIVGLTNA